MVKVAISFCYFLQFQCLLPPACICAALLSPGVFTLFSLLGEKAGILTLPTKSLLYLISEIWLVWHIYFLWVNLGILILKLELAT